MQLGTSATDHATFSLTRRRQRKKKRSIFWISCCSSIDSVHFTVSIRNWKRCGEIVENTTISFSREQRISLYIYVFPQFFLFYRHPLVNFQTHSLAVIIAEIIGIVSKWLDPSLGEYTRSSEIIYLVRYVRSLQCKEKVCSICGYTTQLYKRAYTHTNRWWNNTYKIVYLSNLR